MMRFAIVIFTIVFLFSLLAGAHDLPSPPTTNQLRPVITGNGSGFMAAWIECTLVDGKNQYAVVSEGVGADGEPIAGSRTTIDQRFVSSIAIAHSPSDALVAWVNNGNVYAERLSPSGIALNLISLTSGTDYNVGDVSVAWNGSRYFVVWPNHSQLLGAFIGQDGSWTTPRPFFNESVSYLFPIPPTPAVADLAWNGRHFIVVFGEVRNQICTQLCFVPPPEQFRVMRVSVDGVPTDDSPLVIPPTQAFPVRARVASSGAESLIVLEHRYSGLSTIIARDEGGLTLDPETSLFWWFNEVESAVVWDGVTYTIGWRFQGASVDRNWIGETHMTPSGFPLDRHVTPTGPSIGAYPEAVMEIGVNSDGATAFLTTDGTPGTIERARLVLASEFAPTPPPPPAPANLRFDLYDPYPYTVIKWQQSVTTETTLLERSGDSGETWLEYGSEPGDARAALEPGNARAALEPGNARAAVELVNAHARVETHPGEFWRVRAVGAGGVSEGTIIMISGPPRRRAAVITISPRLLPESHRLPVSESGGDAPSALSTG